MVGSRPTSGYAHMWHRAHLPIVFPSAEYPNLSICAFPPLPSRCLFLIQARSRISCGTRVDLAQSRPATVAHRSEARLPWRTMVYLGLRGAQTALRGVRGSASGSGQGSGGIVSGFGVMNLKAVMALLGRYFRGARSQHYGGRSNCVSTILVCCCDQCSKVV